MGGMSQGMEASGRRVSGPLRGLCDGAFRGRANGYTGWIGDLGHTALSQLRKLLEGIGVKEERGM